MINADGGTRGVLRSACTDVPRDYRDDHAAPVRRQRRSRNNTLGKLLAALYDVAEAGVADCLGKDQ